MSISSDFLLFNFNEILHSGFRGPKSKTEFVWGENPMTPSPILPQVLLP